jgi:ABC-type sugar transport system ATPase subunit
LPTLQNDIAMAFLAAEQISKRFGVVTALRDVSVAIMPGEVHALIGENGAGKSTLMKIFAGVERPTSGRLLLQGQAIEINGPHHAMQLGISVVHQHLQLVNSLTVAENLLLGEAGNGAGIGGLRALSRRRMREAAAEHLAPFGLAHRATATVADLPLPERQIVEIAKALKRRARMLILDEPTSSLNAGETVRLIEHVRRLRAQGTAIVYIAHNLEEIMSIADRITVLRDGRLIATEPASAVNVASLIRMMVGRDLARGYPKKAAAPADVVLAAKHVAASKGATRWSTDLRRHETVGMPTFVGSDVDALLEVLSGQSRQAVGTIALGGRDMTRCGLRRRIRAGIGFVAGDANAKGIIPKMSIEENILLPSLRRFARFGFVRRREARAAVKKMIETLDIRPADVERPVELLSGGNRQKVVLAKWLLAGARILIMDDPTKGIDVGAKVEFYKAIGDFAQSGGAILLASSDLDEIIGISDRIAIIRRGSAISEFAPTEIDKKGILAEITRTAAPAIPTESRP